MQMLHDNVPIFNLRAVVQETGVKPDTLPRLGTAIWSAQS